MSSEGVARRYARAIFEIGKQAGTLATAGKEIAAFADVLHDSVELRSALSNPLVPDSTRERVVRDVAERLQLGTSTVNALRLLVQRGRLEVLPDIARQLTRLIDEDASILIAEVTSASPLSDAYLARLQSEIEKATGQKVQIAYKQDPALIAGVVTRIGDRVIDGSARARLSSFRESLQQS